MLFHVKTTGVCEAKPDQISFGFTFTDKSQTYNGAVEQGANSVIAFRHMMKDFVNPEDIKTSFYAVTRETKKVEKQLPNGRSEYEYVFSHFENKQLLSLHMEYDKIKLFSIIERISNMENGPVTKFNFELSAKSISEMENQATSKALHLAIDKAESIKNALGLSCAKYTKSSIVESFETNRSRYSNSDLEMFCYRSRSFDDHAEQMAESIEPQDVQVKINIESEFEII